MHIAQKGIQKGIGSEDVAYAENEIGRDTKDRADDRGE